MKLRPFELALVIFFGILGVVALIILSSVGPGGGNEGNENYVGPVQIWGTIPAAPFNRVLAEIKGADEEYEQVQYRYVAPDRFNDELVEALADGVGPDVIFISHEGLVEQRKRILPTSYESWPLRDFQDTFVDGAQIYTLSDGVYASPMLVDPLMMYWNKDVLTNNGFLVAPRTWEELVNVQLPALIERSFDRSIRRGVVAFGVYDNTQNAFGVLSTLLIQSGSRLVAESIEYDSLTYSVNLDKTNSPEATPFRNSLSFYLRFGQPANTLYSWNRSFASDLSEFISEDLVFYFGYGSEGKEIETLNPNLNFDIAEVPQGASADVRRTYGKFYGLSPLRSADNLPGASKVIITLRSDASVLALAEEVNMVPLKRRLVSNNSNDLYMRVAYRSAPIAYGWLNPDLTEVDSIFSDTVNDINENRSEVGTGARTAEEKISKLYD